MASQGHAGRLGRIALVGLLLVLAPLAPIVAPSTAAVARAAGGVTATGATTYTVDPAGRRVHVRVDMRITNTMPNRTVGYTTTRYFFTGWSIGVQPEATGVRATRDGARLATTVQSKKGYRLLRFDFGPLLFYRQTAVVRIDYDLPDGGARSDSPIRVGSAFVTFAAWAHGDDRATVRIAVPAGFVVETSGDEIKSVAAADGTILTTDGSVDNEAWYVVITADRPSALGLDELRVPIAGRERIVRIRAWPEDEVWSAKVHEKLQRGLVELGQLTGLEWPVSGPLEVVESYTPSLGGYAGFYVQGEEGQLDTIRITEEPDELVIVHEASHAWFNSELFEGRWIGEGLADAYAALALARMGSPGYGPDPVDRGAKEAFALNAWPEPARIEDEEADRREQYGYNASWTVVRDLIAEIGPVRMRDVLAAAAEGEIAYVGRRAVEHHTLLVRWTDWRYFLDLLEQRGGSKKASDLFATWVLAGYQAASLRDHVAAVAAYRALVERGRGWLPGHAIRAPMAGWSYTVAEALMEDAGAVLDRRARIEPLEISLQVADGGALEGSYEAATLSYEQSLALADDELRTLDALGAAAAAVGAERKPLVAVGLIGVDPAIDLAAARDAYRRGDLEGTMGEAGRAVALIDGADEIGLQRVALGAGGGALVLVAGGGFVLVARRRRRARGLVVPAPAPATLADQPMGEGRDEEGA